MSEETKTGSNRTPRSASSRSNKAARKPWSRPQYLDAPNPPDGLVYRWIRTQVRGEDDKTNVHMRFREGFEPVKPSEVEGYDLTVIDDGKHAGTVGHGGLMLSKIPEETVNERNAYFEQQTENQMRAVDNDLMREENPAMPMTRERKTQVSFGKGKT